MPSLIYQFDLLYASLMKSPLYKYGMSLTKLHEYMAAGKPIVFAVSAINNPVNDCGCSLTVDSSSPVDVADGIRSVYNRSKPEQEKMCLKDYQYALENFDYNILTRKHDLVIMSTVKKSHKRLNN